MVKYWQVVTRDFVPSELVGTMTEGRVIPPEASSLEWVSAHLRELEASYAGQWIAIAKGQVVAYSPNLPDLLQRLSDSRIENPFITEIPSGPVVWVTAYVNKGI